jgi:hypothetical protein
MSELERTLEGLGRDLEYPPVPDIAAAVAQRVRGRRPVRLPARRILAIAFAALSLVAGAAFAAAPGVRHSVLDWLGVRSVHIERVPKLPALRPGPVGGDLGLGTRTTLAAARSHVGFPMLVPALAPDEVYLASAPAGRRVMLVYAPRAGLPRAPETHVGMLVTEFRGDQPAGFLDKTLGPGTTAEPVSVNGEPGVWIAGRPHEIVYRDSNGNVDTDTLRLAGNTLIWRHGDVLVRIEAGVSKGAALRIARSTR